MISIFIDYMTMSGGAAGGVLQPSLRPNMLPNHESTIFRSELIT